MHRRRDGRPAQNATRWLAKSRAFGAFDSINAFWLAHHGKQLLAQLVLLQQATELQQGRRVGHALSSKVDPCKAHQRTGRAGSAVSA